MVTWQIQNHNQSPLGQKGLGRHKATKAMTKLNQNLTHMLIRNQGLTCYGDILAQWQYVTNKCTGKTSLPVPVVARVPGKKFCYLEFVTVALCIRTSHFCQNVQTTINPFDMPAQHTLPSQVSVCCIWCIGQIVTLPKTTVPYVDQDTYVRTSQYSCPVVHEWL